jgi:glycosyltransferase involved in cell wall biosynthesis
MTILGDSKTNSAAKIPTVTVVIPSYNNARYIGQTLDSIKAQTFSDYEVIVVNDGSEDREELERVLASHPLPIIYISQENKGVSAARNAAIRIARGEFYAQLDADDQWTPDYLEVQLGILRENPDVALVYPNARIIGDAAPVELEFMKVSPSEGEVTFESLVRQQCTVLTCVTARMSAIREAGMFDESLRSCEDFDLWLRIVKQGGRIVYHRQVLALYRRHQGSLSSDRVWMLRHLLAVFEKWAQTNRTPTGLTPAELAVVREQISVNRSELRLHEGKRALSSGGASAALVCFQQANQDMHRPKLALVIFLLRHVPRLVVWTFAARQRWLQNDAQHELSGTDYAWASSSETRSRTDEIKTIR